VSSNVGQSYPAGSESEAQRSAAIASAIEAHATLGDTLTAETTPLGEVGPADHGAPARWWIWVCPNPADAARGRLHVAGYARDKHALYTVCDTCGKTYLR
jgi:hypothetical protein